MIRIALALLLVCFPLLRPATAAATRSDAEAAANVIETWLMPRTAAFADAAAEQAKGWREACRDGDPDEAAGLRRDYQATADTWAALQHLSLGPTGIDLRADRIDFYPDRRNAIAKAISGLAAKAADGPIDAAELRGGSVAGQGLPALERLLYDPGSLAEQPKVRCRIGTAVAANVADIAAAIDREWQAPDGPLARLKQGKGDPRYFTDPGQALARLVTDLDSGLHRMIDVEIRPVLGSTADTARPKAAEGWRSDRAARNLQVETESLAAMAAAIAAEAPEREAARLVKSFPPILEALSVFPEEFPDGVGDPVRRVRIENAITWMNDARERIATLAPAFGVTLGFNAQDGD